MTAFEPLRRFDDEQLEQALDLALRDDEPTLVSAIVEEMTRRGHTVEV